MEKNRSVLKQTVFLLLISIFVTGCTVQWVPEYNEPLEAQIINGQKMTSKFYAGMMSDDSINRPYENYKKGYADIILKQIT